MTSASSIACRETQGIATKVLASMGGGLNRGAAEQAVGARRAGCVPSERVVGASLREVDVVATRWDASGASSVSCIYFFFCDAVPLLACFFVDFVEGRVLASEAALNSATRSAQSRMFFSGIHSLCALL